MNCEQCKHNKICAAYLDNNEAIINRCANNNDTVIEDRRKEKHIKDSTELSGGHMW